MGRGTRWRSWLRHCATSREVAGSIPDGVTGIFHWHNPTGRTLALGLTQPLTEMSTRIFPLGVGLNPPVRRVDNLTNFMCRMSWNLEPSGAIQACNGIALPWPWVGKLSADSPYPPCCSFTAHKSVNRNINLYPTLSKRNYVILELTVWHWRHLYITGGDWCLEIKYVMDDIFSKLATFLQSFMKTG